jgi:hypothetical protein
VPRALVYDLRKLRGALAQIRRIVQCVGRELLDLRGLLAFCQAIQPEHFALQAEQTKQAFELAVVSESNDWHSHARRQNERMHARRHHETQLTGHCFIERGIGEVRDARFDATQLPGEPLAFLAVGFVRDVVTGHQENGRIELMRQ